jgi:hypothetical protein
MGLKGYFVRKLTAIIVASAFFAAGFPTAPVFAQAQIASTGAVLSSDQMTMIIMSTINAFPNAGEPLKLAISDLIVQHPELADRIVAYLKNHPELKPAQKEAVFAGLANGLSRLNPVVVQAATGMDPMLIALLVGAAGGAVFGVYELTKSNNNTVSPN